MVSVAPPAVPVPGGGASAGAKSDNARAIETLHEDMIHDAQLDHYGKRLATCSSDRTVKIFDVVDGEPQRTGASGGGITLKGHDGPVWQVAWAHPKFGPILASCSYDGRVFIWKDDSAALGSGSGGAASQAYGSYSAGGGESGTWTRIKEHGLHTASVNSIAWAPHELGPILACASSDGKVSVLTFNDDGTWDASLFNAHPIGTNAVSWAPAAVPGSLISAAGAPGTGVGGGAPPAGQTLQTGDEASIAVVKRFASAGCDNLVRIWEFSDETKAWQEVDKLEGHTDWVRDVAFAPNIGLPRSYLASASQDKTVIIWTQDTLSSAWNKTYLVPNPAAAAVADPSAAAAGPDASNRFADVVWRVSWSVSGNILAVSCGDGKITLWKENLKGGWECVNEMES